jgi:hypothetical protein
VINRSFYLVDLPGYGFCESSKDQQQAWGALMEQYLSSGRVTHLFLLLDIRMRLRLRTGKCFKWMLYLWRAYTLIATKADSCPGREAAIRQPRPQRYWALLRMRCPIRCRKDWAGKSLLERISQVVADAGAANVE